VFRRWKALWPVKSAALDGAAVGDGLGGSRRGGVGRQTPRPPGRGATEGVRGRMTTFSPGRQRREEGAPPGELREELIRTGRGLAPRETEDVQESSLKLESRRPTRLYSIMLVAKVSAGQRAWKPRSRAKVREGGDSRTERSTGCSWCMSVAEVGRRIFPVRRARATSSRRGVGSA
jgi:hypothetical protein